MPSRWVVSLLRCSPALVPIGVLAVLGWRQRWMSDDGLINLRVVDQVLAHNGLVYNAGERVEVATSTLWLGLLVLSAVALPVIETALVAVVLGWALTLLGLAAGTYASARLQRSGPGIWWPAGALVIALCPPMWDFATSGLETGLTFAWIGGCFLALVWRLEARPSRPAYAPVWVPVLIGLGPLIRPDLALMSACFGLALLLQSRLTVRSVLFSILIAAVLPLAWQVFRMGYYAALVPNTALAKSAADARWDQGVAYLLDLVGRYALYVPLAVLILLVIRTAVLAGRTGDRGRTAAILAPLTAGLLHGLYVVRVGGDFMHGRLLLPALFAVTVAAAVVRISKGQRALAVGVVVVVVSALVTGLFLRFPPVPRTDPQTGIADERHYYATRVISGRPLGPADWRGSWQYEVGVRLSEEARRGSSRFEDGKQILPAAPGYRLVYTASNLGIIGVLAGNEVLIADRFALADPVGARVAVDEQTGMRIGHAAPPPVWRQARYAAPQLGDRQSVRDARSALACGQLAELDAAIREPMSPGRFVRNLRLSASLTTLRIPAAPAEARRQLCDAEPSGLR
ncbi:MAG TPA: hypothetical protein VE617_00935 [Propionibacteriaceae bacterium]|nr:hypothetical protein [Propionibacteriaceae bacterium]